MLALEPILVAKFPAFVRWPRHLRKVVLAVLNTLLCVPRINAFLAQHGHLKGRAFVQASLTYLSVNWQVKGAQQIPPNGPLVVVANHPNGIVDGMALYLAVHQVRPDIRIVVNDVLCEFQSMEGVFLPVVNVGDGCNRRHQTRIADYLNQGGSVLLFPSGEVSRLTRKGVRDCAWRKGFLHFARTANAAILPVHIQSRNSGWFYLVGLIASPLAMLMLPGEIFRRRGTHIQLSFGQAVPWGAVENFNAGFAQLPALFRQHVYELATGQSG